MSDHEPSEQQAAPDPGSAGQRLQEARERAGWTRERLAGELCVPLQRLEALYA